VEAVKHNTDPKECIGQANDNTICLTTCKAAVLFTPRIDNTTSFFELLGLISESSKSPEHTWKDITARIRVRRRPGAIQLRLSVPCIGRYELDGQNRCEVFANGYAIYDNGARKTVLWVPNCGSVTYFFAKLRDNEKAYQRETDFVGEDVLGPAPWYVALTIAGEDAIERNYAHPKSEAASSDLEVKEDWEQESAERWSAGAFFESPEEAYIRKENAEARLSALNKDQRIVYSLYFLQGFTQKEIGMMLGISESSVSRRISTIKKKFRADREKFFSM
jgi:RNA polymerase sigma factor (sigma-70 family)